MNDHAETRTAARPRGIVCPCGGRLRQHTTTRPRPGVVVRYRTCDECGSRAVTREMVLVLEQPKIKT